MVAILMQPSILAGCRASRASLSRSLGTACLNRAVVMLFGTLFMRRHWTRKELERARLWGWGCRGFLYWWGHGERRHRHESKRLCDAKGSCGTVFPALRGLELRYRVVERGRWCWEGHWRGWRGQRERRQRRCWRGLTSGEKWPVATQS